MKKLSTTSSRGVRPSRISAHLIGRDRVVKVRTPVILFLTGGQQAGRKSTSVPNVAEEPRLTHVLCDVLRDVERHAVDVVDWLKAGDPAMWCLEPFGPKVGAL